MDAIQATLLHEPWWNFILVLAGVLIGCWLYQQLSANREVASGEEVAMAITKAQEEKREASAIADGFLDMIDDYHVHGILDDKSYDKWYNRVKNVFTLYDLDSQRKPLKERLKILKHKRDQLKLKERETAEEIFGTPTSTVKTVKDPETKPKLSLLRDGKRKFVSSSKAVAA